MLFAQQTDINIRSIPLHTQANVLVRRAQQLVLDVDDIFPDDKPPTSGSRSPLSTTLTAYGKTLALERRLKLVEEKEKVGSEDLEDKEGLVRGRGQEEREPLCTGYAYLGAATA